MGAASPTFTAVSAGYDSTCALTTAGGVDCWGWNLNGELGDGTTTDSLVAVAVSGLSSGVSAVSAGYDSTCALTSAGGVKCWGDNTDGELGNGTTTSSSVPVAVSGLSSGVSAVSAGGADACALTSAGAVKCWGDNTDGELGNGTTTSSSVPVAVSGLSSGVSAVSTGLQFDACALTSAGGVKCWGWNNSGQLGNGTTTNSSVPVAVSGLSSGVSAISAGGFDTCALTSAGGVVCWGYNADGELGNKTGMNSSVPVAMSTLSSGVSAVRAGAYHICALTSAGGVESWGWNGLGQLGNGTTTSSSVPVALLTSSVPNVTKVSPNSGPSSGGTTVTITGTGFVAGATVEIGQGYGPGSSAIVATSVDVVSSTEITAVTGGGAKGGTFNLYVIASGATSADNTGDFFTYTSRPNVTKVSPNSGPSSGGTTVTITGTGFVAGATVEIGQGSGPGPSAIVATSVDVVSSTEITAVTGGGATTGTFSLFVITPGGTSAGHASDNFTYS